MAKELKVNSKWLLLIIIQFLLMLLSVSAMVLHIISGLFAGIICMIVTFVFAFFLFLNGKLFSPITASLIFDASFALYIMKLVKNYYDLPYNAMILILLCMLLWKFITVLSPGFRFKKNVTDIKLTKIDRFSVKIILSVLFVIVLTATVFEWKMAGGVPVLREDQETFRFMVSYNSITHMLSIMSKIVATMIGVFIINDTGGIRHNKLLIFFAIVAELLMIGTAMRGEMMMAPCVIFIVFAIRKKVPVKYYLIFGIILIIIIGFFPFARKLGLYGTRYISDLKIISTFPELYIFTPFYESFATNLSILKLDLEIFPYMRPFGMGDYSILPQIPFVDLGRSLGTVQNEILNNNFYGGLTATYLSSWYADFGYVGFFIATAIYGLLTNISYNLYVKKKDIVTLTWYAYTFYCSLWIFYSSTFDMVYVVYSLLILFVLKIHIKRT
jgi:oligosaccharide repeat unit polymerase